MTHPNINFPLQNFGHIEDEIWRQVIHHGHTLDDYKVSNYGNVIGPRGHKLRWANSYGYPAIGLTIDKDFSGHEYAPKKDTHKRVNSTVNVHVLVATAFIPLDESRPEVFDEYITINGKSYSLWDLLSTECKLFIRSLLNVDHIDNNRGNPHVSNLQYITPRDNNLSVKKNAK